MGAPLMSAGLDSLAAAAFVTSLAARVSADIAPTELFDHPTLSSIASFLAREVGLEATEASPRSSTLRIVQQQPHRRASRRGGETTIAARSLQLAGALCSDDEVRSMSVRALSANTRVPAARWSTPTPGVGPSATYGSFVSAHQLLLDRSCFGISALEARSLDPQQRLVLHVGYGALGRVGGPGSQPTANRDALVYADIGVFVGVESSGLSAVSEQTSTFSASGGALSIASGRLSYSLGLVGPCYSIDTACASALAALHACASAVPAECGGGVAVGTKVLSEAGNYATSAGGMTSPHGRCHTFDRRADGYCRGEGCGAFFVTSRATNDDGGAVRVLGSAVQQDGPSASLTAPNGSSQRRLIETVRRALAGEEGVPVLEAHGTGTALGDPIEVWFLASAER